MCLYVCIYVDRNKSLWLIGLSCGGCGQLGFESVATWSLNFLISAPAWVQPVHEFSVILRCAHSEFPGSFGHPLADWAGFFFSGFIAISMIFRRDSDFSRC